MTIFQEKTIKYIGQSPNPAAVEVLAAQLNHTVDRVRSLAFDALYLKKNTELYALLFKVFLRDEDYWLHTKSLPIDRLGRLAEMAFQNQDAALHNAAAQTILKYKLYSTLPAIIPGVEGADKNLSQESRNIVLQLAESFYADLSKVSELERRNLEQRREWFVQQLDASVKRFASTGFEEPLQSLLILTKKNYDTMQKVMNDHRSSACQKIVDFLQNGEHGSYVRLLLSYLDDVNAPPVIDEILTSRSDTVFVRKLLEVVGVNPSFEFSEALKRFKDFAWLTPNNKGLQKMIEGLEPCAVQLVQASSIPKSQKISLYRFFFENPSFESRRAAAASVRRLVGDEVNTMLLDFINDADAPTAAAVFRILKSRGVKEVEASFEQLVNRTEPEILKAIYEMIPELHVESFASRIIQMTSETAKKLGQYVRLVDPGTKKVIGDDIFSPIPIRRMSACLVAAATGYAADFADRLIEIAEFDDETNVRCTALSALPSVLTKDSVETLKHLVNDQSMVIRDAAAVALRNWMVAYQAAQAARNQKQ